MKDILAIGQILLSVALTVLIFLQPGGGDDGRSSMMSVTGVQKRGWEKVIFVLTIVILVIFFISSIVQTII